MATYGSAKSALIRAIVLAVEAAPDPIAKQLAKALDQFVSLDRRTSRDRDARMLADLLDEISGALTAELAQLRGEASQ